MKLVVFGGGGFIGSAICERLLADGHQLRIFERPRVPPYRHFAKMSTLSGPLVILVVRMIYVML